MKKINEPSNSIIGSEYEEDYLLNFKDIKSEYYPIYPSNLYGYTLLYSIHIHLLSIKENKKNSRYPEYIMNANEEEINTKKDILDLLHQTTIKINIMNLFLKN